MKLKLEPPPIFAKNTSLTHIPRNIYTDGSLSVQQVEQEFCYCLSKNAKPGWGRVVVASVFVFVFISIFVFVEEY